MSVSRSRAVGADIVKKLEQSRDGERQRIAKLLGPTTVLEQDPKVLQEALASLRLHHEELAVAEEELREQVDELTRMGITLEAERQRYADLFALAPDAHIVTDREGIIREANHAAAELFRIEPRFLRSKPFAAFVDVGEGDALHDLLASRLDVPRTLALHVRPRGGGEIAVDARVGTMAHGTNLVWILSVIPAGTHLSPDERMLRDRTELLERERRLRIDFERSNRAKDRFIAVLAHDLRAPLNAIMGWTQLLQREHLDKKARDSALATIERNAQAQARLIEELLDVSRLDADKLQLSLEPIDFGVLVRRAVEDVLPNASRLEITVTCTCADELTVVGDRSRLAQVLSNLLSNAIKYTSAGGRVVVSAERDGNQVRLTVADTGRGIAPDLLPLVFEMYVQDRTQLTARRGLGLGLHIVKQLVSLHDGNVEATSDGDGLGTTLTVRLPLHGTSRAAPSEKLVLPTASLARLVVMVVDDEADERELMAAVLRRAGAEVHVADGAGGALAIFERCRPDLMVSDIAMPTTDGCELLRLLREKDADLAAIAVSGFTNDDETKRALAAGFDGHMGKPCPGDQLVELVDDAARRHHR